jgi:hypothetical protein
MCIGETICVCINIGMCVCVCVFLCTCMPVLQWSRAYHLITGIQTIIYAHKYRHLCTYTDQQAGSAYIHVYVRTHIYTYTQVLEWTERQQAGGALIESSDDGVFINACMYVDMYVCNVVH